MEIGLDCTRRLASSEEGLTGPASHLRPADRARGEAEEILGKGNTILHTGVLERALWRQSVDAEWRGGKARGREGSSEAVVGTEGRGHSEDGEARPRLRREDAGGRLLVRVRGRAGLPGAGMASAWSRRPRKRAGSSRVLREAGIHRMAEVPPRAQSRTHRTATCARAAEPQRSCVLEGGGQPHSAQGEEEPRLGEQGCGWPPRQLQERMKDGLLSEGARGGEGRGDRSKKAPLLNSDTCGRASCAEESG